MEWKRPVSRPDPRWLQGCILGEAGAWDGFVAQYTPLLSGVCRRVLARCGRPSGPQEVSDMLQGVFLHLLESERRALKAYRGEASFEGYLATVAAYQVLKAVRAMPRRSAMLPADLAIDGGAPSDPLEARESAEALQQALADLTSQARLGLALQTDGVPLREIGRLLGMTEGAAAQLLSRARARLRERLGGPDP